MIKSYAEKILLCTFFTQASPILIDIPLFPFAPKLIKSHFTSKLNQMLKQSDIEVQLYSLYVDDIVVVAKTVQSNLGELKDRETLRKIQAIANGIHESIKVTIDFPSKHANNRMPVLDTEQWIEPVKCGNEMRCQILHSHMKPIASKHVINKNSALSQETKINILVADLVRIMRNVSPLCSNTERTEHVQHFINRLQFSGYPQKDRITIFQKANQKYNKIVDNDISGKCPMYRGKFWNRQVRDEEKSKKRNTWFAKGGFETVLFVDATPRSELAKECRGILKEAELKIKVVEKSGKLLKRYLTRSDPFKLLNCESEECYVCKVNPTLNCKTRDAVYEIKCTCGENYIGETARSLGERCNEHIKKLERKESTSVFHQHMIEKHSGTEQSLSIQLLGTCPNDAMLRQVTEATYIHMNNPELNAKEEWGNSNVPRTRFDQRSNESNLINNWQAIDSIH